jgi:hypothetical protein
MRRQAARLARALREDWRTAGMRRRRARTAPPERRPESAARAP